MLGVQVITVSWCDSKVNKSCCTRRAQEVKLCLFLAVDNESYCASRSAWGLKKNLEKPHLVIKNSDGNSHKDPELSRDAKQCNSTSLIELQKT